MTAALEGGEWSAARPGRTLPPGKTRYPFYKRLGGPQGRSGRAKNLVPTGIRSRTVQPVVSRYTDWATGPTFVSCKKVLKKSVILLKTIAKFSNKIAEFKFKWIIREEYFGDIGDNDRDDKERLCRWQK